MANEMDCVDLGLTCADICTAIGRGMDGRKLDDLSQSVYDAIAQLMACMMPTIHSFRSSLMALSITFDCGGNPKKDH